MLSSCPSFLLRFSFVFYSLFIYCTEETWVHRRSWVYLLVDWFLPSFRCWLRVHPSWCWNYFPPLIFQLIRAPAIVCERGEGAWNGWVFVKTLHHLTMTSNNFREWCCWELSIKRRSDAPSGSTRRGVTVQQPANIAMENGTIRNCSCGVEEIRMFWRSSQSSGGRSTAVEDDVIGRYHFSSFTCKLWDSRRRRHLDWKLLVDSQLAGSGGSLRTSKCYPEMEGGT